MGGKRMCSLTMDICEPRSCAYTVCVAKKVLPNGVCGRTLRRKTRPISIEEGLKLDKEVIKGKLRNLEDEIF
ncbi:MAG: hypothetical protein ACE5GD_00795 [Candidatus Geothermarchaeales archaeon]